MAVNSKYRVVVYCLISLVAVLLGLYALRYCQPETPVKVEGTLKRGVSKVDSTKKGGIQIKWVRETHVPKPETVYLYPKWRKSPVLKTDTCPDLMQLYDTFFVFSDTVKVGSHHVIINDSVGGRIYRRSVGLKLSLPDTVFISRVDTFIPDKMEDQKSITLGLQVGLYLTPAGIQPGVGVGGNFPLTTLFKRGVRTKKNNLTVSY